jgi:hypothetical protein
MGISFKDLLDKLNILHYLNVPWMVLYLIYYFGADRKLPGPIRAFGPLISLKRQGHNKYVARLKLKAPDSL